MKGAEIYRSILTIRVYFLFIIIASLVHSNDTNIINLHLIRKHIFKFLHDSHVKKCHYFPVNAMEDFNHGKWNTMSKDSDIVRLTESRNPINVYSPCLSTYNIGNSLGNYFSVLFCSLKSSTNIIIAKKVWDHAHMPIEYKGQELKRFGGKGLMQSFSIRFMDILPTEINVDFKDKIYLTSSDPSNFTIIFEVSKNITNSIFIDKIQIDEYKRLKFDLDSSHINTWSYQKSQESMIKNCACEKYCWQDKSAPWIEYYHIIQSIMINAVTHHIESTDHKKTSFNPSVDLSINYSPKHIELIPEVAIHYRCGDTVPSTTYGFLSFNTIISIIKSNIMEPESIYVLSDPPKRASIMFQEPPFAKKCTPLLESFLKHLQKHFPKTTNIIVHRSGDPLVDFSRLALAKLTICSVSTFCLWPAIANKNKVYFPASSLAGGYQPLSQSTVAAYKPLPTDSIIPSISGDTIIVTNNSFNVVDEFKLPYFGPSFYWIRKPLIINEFQDNTSLEKVLKKLNS